MLNYYAIAKSASLKIGSHPGLKYLQNICHASQKILDVGCGEGSRLATLLPATKTGWGVDINPQAIAQASRQYPRNKFLVAPGEKLPFSKNSFDVVYSAFTLEHTLNPQQVVLEMLRVCKISGQVVLLAPNFGAPNRRSPNSHQLPLAKLFTGFFQDFSTSSGLTWQAVTPKGSYSQIDDDTTVEPYLHSLQSFLVENSFEIIQSSSLWDLDPPTLHPRKALLKFLGQLKIYPFTYWGPQLFITARKKA